MALEPITRQEQIIAGKDLEPITRMEKFLKEYGGGGASHWNELEGKPFVTVGGDTLEWDGNTEGKAVIDLAGDGSELLVCVQEGAPMPDAGASFSVENSDGSTTSGTISSNGEIWQAFDGTKMCAFGTMTDNVSYAGIFTLPKAGIYLPWSSAVYTNSLTIPGYTGFTKEQIDPAVLPESPIVIVGADDTMKLDKTLAEIQALRAAGKTVLAMGSHIGVHSNGDTGEIIEGTIVMFDATTTGSDTNVTGVALTAQVIKFAPDGSCIGMVVAEVPSNFLMWLPVG